MNKTLIIIIAIVVLGGLAFILWRSYQTSNTQGNNNSTATTSPTSTVSPTATTIITTPTVSSTVTPTPSVTTTVSPTPTQTVSESSEFETGLNSDWVYGLTTQKVGNDTYFVGGTDMNQIKKGTSATDTNATVIYTAESDHKIGSFNVVGTSIILALTRNSAGQSRLIRYYPSSSQKTNLYTYESSKVEIAQFLIPKTVGTEYYIGLNGLNNAYQPMVIYSKQYSQQWARTLEGSTKNDKITAMGITTDAKSLKAKIEYSGSSKVITLDISTNGQ